MQDRLVRGRPFVVAPLRHGFSIATHVLGHTRLVCDERVLEILAWHARPRRPSEVAKHFEESERGVSFVLGHLVQAQLLVPESLDARRRIRDAFASRRAELPPVLPSMPLPASTVGRWEAPGASASEQETAAFALTTRSRLVLSPHTVSMRVCPGETIALHPLGSRVHLDERLWRLACAFRAPSTIADVQKRLGGGSSAEILSACRFLVLRQLLWSSRASERRAFHSLARELDVRPDGPSARQWTQPHHQWTDTATPYDWTDVSGTTAFGRVAVIGQCQINFAGAALQRLAQRHHVHLELFGEAAPSAALAGKSWASVFVSLADGASELHEAAARGDWNSAQSQIPRVLAYLDELLAAVRRHTRAPVAVLSVAPPSLSPFPEDAATQHARARLYAELNHRLADALRDPSTYLLDESRVVGARDRDRVFLDDEYAGSAHHCAYNPRFWIELTQWAGAKSASGVVEERTYPEGDPQAGASDAVASALFEFLRRRHERAPVRAVVFDADALLWSGYLRDKPSAHESLQRSQGRPDYQFHCGVNEALLALHARGVRLICMSPLASDTVREKWNVPADSTRFVSAAHLAGIVRTARELEDLLALHDICARECLLLGLGSAPKLAGARVFRGDRWSIKRYLLTAPELASEQHGFRAFSSRVVSARSRESLPEAEIEATVDAAIERHLRLHAGHARRADDLRPLGLDSLTALELVHDIEAKLDFQFEDRDLTVATIYRRPALVGAAVRARGTPAAESRSGADARRTNDHAPLFAHDAISDILQRHVESARHPWQFKMVLSTKPNDYEYVGWSTLLERARGYADLFASLGATPGNVVTLMLPQGLALVSAFLGAILYDFIPSIVAAPSVKLSESAFVAWFGEVASRSGTALILCAPEHEELVRACIAGSPSPHIQVSSRGAAPPGQRALAPGRRAGRPLLLQHSSGTTGLKKGVLLDERAVVAQVRHLAASLGCAGRAARDVIVSWLPLYHDMGLIACLLLPLLADLPVVMMSPFDWLKCPDLLLREVTREHGTLSWMPNFAFMYSASRISDESLDGVDLSSWRAVVNCSEPVTERATDAFHRRFAGVGLRRSALSASFAMAETTFAVTQVPPGRGLVSTPVDAESWRTRGIARPAADVSGAPVVLTGSGEILEGTAVEIVDSHGKVQDSGHAGEIRVRSDSLMHGYFADPEATAAVLRGGWYYTGDVGVVLGRELYVTGRKKDLVIVAGHNVSPHDVEESLGALQALRPGRVVALGIEDEAVGTERLVILAETREKLDEDESAALRERIRAHVSSVFGVAAHDVRLFSESSLLKSTSGKLSRARNRTLYLEHAAGERSPSGNSSG